MPLVVGGKGAQREEVFSIINLSLQSFVLFCKQLRQQQVLSLPNIMYTALSLNIIPKRESLNWFWNIAH